MRDDNIEIDENLSIAAPSEDVMASYGGFLDMRKRDRNMARNTEMSQLDNLVTNLRTDIDGIMDSKDANMARRYAALQSLQSARSIQQSTKAGKEQDLKAKADKKEEMIRLDDMSDMDSVILPSQRESEFVLQKRPSNVANPI